MTGIVDFRTELLDEEGNPISASNPLPVTGGGGGGGSALADVLLTDDTGTLFVARDDGTTITYFDLNGNAAYTPSGTIQAAGLTDAQLRATPVSVSLTGGSGGPIPVEDANTGSLLWRILQMLMAPLGYDKALQRQRGTVIVESGTVTTVSTVTNVTSVNNLDGYNARMQVLGQNLTAWHAVVRSRIS